MVVVKEEEAFDEDAYDLLRAHYFAPVVEHDVVDPRTSRSGHQRVLKRKVSPLRIDSKSPGFVKLKQEILALEGRGDRPRALALLRALREWELRPQSLGGAQRCGWRVRGDDRPDGRRSRRRRRRLLHHRSAPHHDRRD